MDSLPPRLQMFMAGCPAELEAKRDRISCRQVVMRTVLALAEGVHRTAYWNLAPEYPGPVDHLQMMHLIDRQAPAARLPGWRPGGPSSRGADLRPARGADGGRAGRVPRRRDGPSGLSRLRGRPAPARPLLVVWDHRDPFDGEDEPPADRELAVARRTPPPSPTCSAAP